MHVRLAREVDPKSGEGRLERLDQPARREQLVEVGGPEESRQVGPSQLAERRKGRPLELRIQQRGVPLLGLLQESRRLPSKPPQIDRAQLRVCIGVAGPPKFPADLVTAVERRAVDRVESL